MPINTSKKAVAIGLSLSMMANASSPINAVDLVDIPQNNSSVIIPPNTSIDKSRSTSFSMKSIKTKVLNIFNLTKNDEVNNVNRKQLATYSGTCGNDISWTLNTDTGLLNISGVSNDYLSHHNMDNYNSYNETPWSSYKDSIKSVKINGRINNIGSHAFDNCTNLTDVVSTGLNYPNFVGHNAFYNCEKLKQFKYEGKGQPDCGVSVFNGSKELKEIIVPANYKCNEFCGLPIKRLWTGSDYGLIILVSLSALIGGIAAGFFGYLSVATDCGLTGGGGGGLAVLVEVYT